MAGEIFGKTSSRLVRMAKSQDFHDPRHILFQPFQIGIAAHSMLSRHAEQQPVPHI
jgi:hypothetical protein